MTKPSKECLDLAVFGDVERREAELARLAKALGHPVRVRILRLLARRNACVCGEIVDELPLAQSTVSQHLKVLKQAGLLQGEVDGPRVCYCLVPGALDRLSELLATELAPRPAGQRPLAGPVGANSRNRGEP